MINNERNIELLAPAGGMDQLRTAINFGADAVYLAGKSFGMRAKAQNFSKDELNEAIAFAHKNNVKAYVTCNVLIHEGKLDQLKDHIREISEAHADAIIVGDLAAMSIAKEVAPELEIHISTQASVANSTAAIEYAKLGARRIILAREMSLTEIKKMRDALDEAGYKDTPDNPNALSLEAFVHGAMCMSISGRCLISSYLTGRSANEGLCTQPCRWGYSLTEENRPGQNFDISEDEFGTYIMNSKDMNMLAHLDEIAQAGISSIKIEGRNKKALYVATTVSAYRHCLDALRKGADEYQKALNMWAPEMNNVSHRPYSTGFYFGQAEQTPNYDGYEQNCVHAADVLDCQTHSTFFGLKKFYVLKLKCRNHFEEGETLDALIPGKDINRITIENLKWYPDEKSGGKEVKVANRASNIYSCTCDYPLLAGTLLRSKTYLRTSRT